MLALGGADTDRPSGPPPLGAGCPVSLQRVGSVDDSLYDRSERHRLNKRERAGERRIGKQTEGEWLIGDNPRLCLGL